MKIPPDKLLHATCSALLTAIFAVAAPVWMAAMIALFIGGMKELLWDDALRQGDPAWGDFLADCIGVALGVLLLYALAWRYGVLR